MNDARMAKRKHKLLERYQTWIPIYFHISLYYGFYATFLFLRFTIVGWAGCVRPSNCRAGAMHSRLCTIYGLRGFDLGYLKLESPCTTDAS